MMPAMAEKLLLTAQPQRSLNEEVIAGLTIFADGLKFDAVAVSVTFTQACEVVSGDGCQAKSGIATQLLLAF